MYEWMRLTLCYDVWQDREKRKREKTILNSSGNYEFLHIESEVIIQTLVFYIA